MKLISGLRDYYGLVQFMINLMCTLALFRNVVVHWCALPTIKHMVNLIISLNICRSLHCKGDLTLTI
jgi:hypothetical protein